MRIKIIKIDELKKEDLSILLNKWNVDRIP